MNSHDSWADYYDCVYKLVFKQGYQDFTNLTLRKICLMAPPRARIVDFGAGTGRLAIPLAQTDFRVTAIEASSEMCRVLRAKAAAGVEGAVQEPCADCQRRPHQNEQKRPVEVTVINQSICEPLQDNEFDLGLCVFTVLNYIVKEKDMIRFASVAASAIRVGGKLLVSFVDDMEQMQSNFNGRDQAGKSSDGRCSVKRKINIRTLTEMLYEYHEQSELTKDANTFRYSDTFQLREWSREKISATIQAAGFRVEREEKLLGEVYFLFSRD